MIHIKKLDHIVLRAKSPVTIANRIQVFFKDGTKTDSIACEYPIGHRKRRSEAKTALQQKFINNLSSWSSKEQIDLIIKTCSDNKQLAAIPADQFVDLFITKRTD